MSVQAGNADWLRVCRPDLAGRLGCVRHALFDFDGTLSLLREGWEQIMAPMMVASICGERPPTREIIAEVQEYIERSTGLLTILQMQWLEQAVKRHGLVAQPRSAAEYKAIYVEQILARVQERRERLARGAARLEDYLVPGGQEFLAALKGRGVSLYLASGTDHRDVLNEAALLELDVFFDGQIYGALDDIEAHDKGRVIRRILSANALRGEELLVVGDGPVEIAEGAACGALTLGVASDEIRRCGWNEKKVARLAGAGADLLIPDYAHGQELLAYLFSEETLKPREGMDIE